MSVDIPTNETDLCFLPATAQRELLRTRAISARELLRAYLDRIEAVNPAVNAIVTLDAEGAMAQATAADDALARGEDIGPLHGLVIAHKDLLPTAGMRTTFGSPLTKDFVPDEDAAIASRMRGAGAIRLGKTNVPEHGAGSHTFNRVFGATYNPYDLSKSAGGSSGGAAAALAAGLVSLADGSDYGGSLRNPASFCNVVGLRSVAGRIPKLPVDDGYSHASVVGAMGRTVADVALLQSVLAGFEPLDPISLPGDGSEFGAIAASEPARSLTGVRVGWSQYPGGAPVEPAVTAVIENAGKPVLEGLGARVIDMEPDFEGAEYSFRTIRAWGMVQKHGAQYRENKGQLTDNLIANVEMGLELTPADIHDALAARTRLYQRFVTLFDGIDILATPTVQVASFPVEWNCPMEVAGEVQTDYLGWMRSCWYVSATGLPAISVPCGFTDDGLPVGIQFVGSPLGEAELLRFALAFEAANPVWKRRPA
ncbi:MAG TPA: amidase family protein [Thermomicrobiales bacterium]|nr:amidase family protein [Thermomicrobiales bacterium]